MKRSWHGHEQIVSQTHAISYNQNTLSALMMATILIMQFLTCLTNIPYSTFQLSLILAVDINNPVSPLFIWRWDKYLIVVLVVATLLNVLFLIYIMLPFHRKGSYITILDIRHFFSFICFLLIIPLINVIYPAFIILSQLGSRDLDTLPPILLNRLRDPITMKIDASFLKLYPYLIPLWIYLALPLIGFLTLATVSVMHIYWVDYDVKSSVTVTNGCLLLPHLYYCVFIKLYEIFQNPYYYGFNESLQAILLFILSILFYFYALNTSIFLTFLQNLAGVLFTLMVLFFTFINLLYTVQFPIPSVSFQVFLIFAMIELSFLIANFQFRHSIERTIRFLTVSSKNARKDEMKMQSSEPFPISEVMAPLSSSTKFVISLISMPCFIWLLISYPFLRRTRKAFLNTRNKKSPSLSAEQQFYSGHTGKDPTYSLPSIISSKGGLLRTNHILSDSTLHRGGFSTALRFRIYNVHRHNYNTKPRRQHLPYSIYKPEYDSHGNFLDFEFSRLLQRKQMRRETAVFTKTKRKYDSEQYIRDFQGLTAAHSVPLLAFLKMLTDFNRLSHLDKLFIKSYMRDYYNRENLPANKSPGLYFRRPEDVLVVCAYISGFYKLKILHTTFAGQKVFSSSNVLHYYFLREICFVLEAHWSNPHVIYLLYYSLLLNICNNKAQVIKEVGDLLNFGTTANDAENLIQQDMGFKRESQEAFIKFVLENKDSLIIDMQMKLDAYIDKINSLMDRYNREHNLDEQSSVALDTAVEQLHLRILESHVTATSLDEELMQGNSVITAWTNNMKLLRGQLDHDRILMHKQQLPCESKAAQLQKTKDVGFQKAFRSAMKSLAATPRMSVLSIFHLTKVYMRSIFGSTSEITSDIQLSELAMTQTIVQLFIETYKERYTDINFAFIALCQFQSSFDGAINSFKNIQKRYKHDPIHTILHLMLLVFLPLVPLNSRHYRHLLDKYKNTNLVISNDGTPFYIKHNVNKVTVYRSYEILSKFSSMKRFSRILYPLFANDRLVYDDRFIVESSLRIGTAETRPIVGTDARFMFGVSGTVCKRVLSGLDKERGIIKQYASNIDQLNEMKRLRTITTVQNSRFIKKNPVTNAIYLGVTRVDYLHALVATWNSRTKGVVRLITQKKSFIFSKIIEGIAHLIILASISVLVLLFSIRQLRNMNVCMEDIDMHVTVMDKIYNMLASLSHLPNKYKKPIEDFFIEIMATINKGNTYHPHWNPYTPVYNEPSFLDIPSYEDTKTFAILPVYVQRKVFELIEQCSSKSKDFSFYKAEFYKLLDPLHQYIEYFLKYSGVLVPFDTMRLLATVYVQLMLWILVVLVIFFVYRAQVTFNQMRHDYTILLHLFVKLPANIRRDIASYWITHNISRLRLADIFNKNLPAYCEGLLRDIKRLNNVETSPSILDMEILQNAQTNRERYSRRIQLLLKKYISSIDDETNENAQMSATIAKYIRIQQRHKQILDIAIAQQDARLDDRLDDGSGVQLTSTQLSREALHTSASGVRSSAECSTSSANAPNMNDHGTSKRAQKMQRPKLSYGSKWNAILCDLWQPMVLRKSLIPQSFKTCNIDLYNFYTNSPITATTADYTPFLEPISIQRRRERLSRQKDLDENFNTWLYRESLRTNNWPIDFDYPEINSFQFRMDVKDLSCSAFSDKILLKRNRNSTTKRKLLKKGASKKGFAHESHTRIVQVGIQSENKFSGSTDNMLLERSDTQDYEPSLIADVTASVPTKKRSWCSSWLRRDKKQSTNCAPPAPELDLSRCRWYKKRSVFMAVMFLILGAFAITESLGYVFLQAYASIMQYVQDSSLKSGYLSEKLSALTMDEFYGHIAYAYALTLDDSLYNQYSLLVSDSTVHEIITDIFREVDLMQTRSWLFSALLRELEAAITELRRLNNIGVFLAYYSNYENFEIIDTTDPNKPLFKSRDFLTDYVYRNISYNIDLEMKDPNSIRSQLSQVVMGSEFVEQNYGHNILNKPEMSYTEINKDLLGSSRSMRQNRALGTLNSIYYHKVVYSVRKISSALISELNRLRAISFLDETVDGANFYSLYFKKYVKDSLIANLGQQSSFMDLFYYGNKFINTISLTHQRASKHFTDSYRREILRPFMQFNFNHTSPNSILNEILTAKFTGMDELSKSIGAYVINQFTRRIIVFIVLSCVFYALFFVALKFFFCVKFTKALMLSFFLMGISTFLLIASFIYLMVKMTPYDSKNDLSKFASIVMPLFTLRNWILDIALKSRNLVIACIDVDSLLLQNPMKNASAFVYQALDRLGESLAITIERGLALEQGGYDPMYPDPHAYYFNTYLYQQARKGNDSLTDEELISNYEENNRTLDFPVSRKIIASILKNITPTSRMSPQSFNFTTGPNGNAYTMLNHLLLLLPEDVAVSYYNALLYNNEIETRYFLTWLRAEVQKRTNRDLSETHYLQEMIRPNSKILNILYYYKRPAVGRFSQSSQFLSLNSMFQNILHYLGGARRSVAYYFLWRNKTLDHTVVPPDSIINPFEKMLQDFEEATPVGILYSLHAPRKFIGDMINPVQSTTLFDKISEHIPYRYQFSTISVDSTPHFSGYPYTPNDSTRYSHIALLNFLQICSKHNLNTYSSILEHLNMLYFSNMEQAARIYDSWTKKSNLLLGIFRIGPYIFGLSIVVSIIVLIKYLTRTSTIMFPFISGTGGVIDQLRPELLFKQRKYYNVMITTRKVLYIAITAVFIIVSLFLIFYNRLLLYSSRFMYVLTRLLHDATITKTSLAITFGCMMSVSDECTLADLSMKIRDLQKSVEELLHTMSFIEVSNGLQIPYISKTWLGQSFLSQREFRNKKLFIDSYSIYSITGGSLIFEPYVYKLFYKMINLIELPITSWCFKDLTTLYWAVQQGDIYTIILNSAFNETYKDWFMDKIPSVDYLRDIVTSDLQNPLYKSITSYTQADRIKFFELASDLNLTIKNKDRYDIYREIYQKTVNKFSTIFDVEHLTARNVNWTQYIHNVSILYNSENITRFFNPNAEIRFNYTLPSLMRIVSLLKKDLEEMYDNVFQRNGHGQYRDFIINSIMYTGKSTSQIKEEMRSADAMYASLLRGIMDIEKLKILLRLYQREIHSVLLAKLHGNIVWIGIFMGTLFFLETCLFLVCLPLLHITKDIKFLTNMLKMIPQDKFKCLSPYYSLLLYEK